MLKKTITYEDYNGVERTEDFYFNLSESELLDMEYDTSGGMSGLLQGIANTKDESQLVKFFMRIILAAYGEKSPDGRRFMKSKEISEAFSQTNAYNVLLLELGRDDKKAAEFINGIMPASSKKNNPPVSLQPAT